MDTSTTTQEVAVAPPTVDLTSYLLIHRAFRDGARRVADTVALITGRDVPGPDPAQLRALHRWYTGMHHELDLHHRVEDDLFFPALADRVPVFAEHEGRLHAEHELIVTAMERTARGLQHLATDRADADRQRDAVAATEELASLLESHLAYEDADILPLFVRHLTKSEYEAIETAAQKQGSLKDMAFTVPFIVATTSGDERTILFDSAPTVLKGLWYLTRGRHARLTAKAFAS